MARTHNRIVDAEPEPEPVDESTLPPVPLWPIWIGMAIAAAGLVLFAVYPNGWMFWLGLPLSEIPLWIAFWRRWDKAKKLGYREPESFDAVPQAGEIWGPP